MQTLEELFSLRGRRALVTGASSGLGVECAHALALAGADVSLIARRGDRVVKLAKELEDAKARVTIGATYRHFKGADKLYKVMGLGFLEANDELCVIYRALYGESLTFLRPVSVWLERVEWEGKTVPRFTLVAPEHPGA